MQIVDSARLVSLRGRNRGARHSVLVMANSALVLICVTEIHRLTALFAIDFRVAAIFLFLASLILGIVNICAFPRLLRQKQVLLFLGLILILPILSSLFFGDLSIDILAKSFQFFSIYIAATVLTEIAPLRRLRSLIDTCILVICIFAILSLLYPLLFLPMALQVNATIAHDGRAFGLFLQPNVLAVTVAFLLLSRPDRHLQSSSWYYDFVAYCVSIGSVVLSGSRYGMVLLAAVLVVKFLTNRKRNFSGRNYVISHIFKRTIYLVLIGMIVSVLLPALALGIRNMHQVQAGSGLDRALSMFELRLSHSGDADGINTLSRRHSAQDQYLELILERPLFGYGPSAERLMLSDQSLELSAHSSALSIVLRYGVLYLLLYMWIIIRPMLKWRHSDRYERVKYFCCAVLYLLSIALNHGLIENFVFFISMPLMVMLLRLRTTAQEPGNFKKTPRFTGIS